MRIIPSESSNLGRGPGIILAFLVSIGLLLVWLLGSSSAVFDAGAEDDSDTVAVLDLQPEQVTDEEHAGEVPPVRAIADLVETQPVEPEPNELWGLVVSASNGQPIADAEIRLVHRDADEFWNLDLEYGKRERLLAEARSDAEGRFGFTVARGLSHRLGVEAQGYAGRTVTSCVGGSEVRIELDRGAGVAGFVREKGSGKPISDAMIRVGVRGESNPLGVTRSLSDGSFDLSGLPRAEVYVQARPRDYSEVWQRVDLIPGQTHRVNFEMPVGQMVSGRVTDAVRGLGIAGAELSDSWTFKRFVKTDSDGRYELRGVDGNRSIHLRAKGFARKVKPVSEAVAGHLDFVLSQGGGVRGRVIDADGKPLSSVYVAVASSFMTRSGIQSTDWLPVEVGKEGRFLRRGMNSEWPYSIYLRGRGFGTRVYELPRAVDDGEVLEIGDLVMKPAGGIEGLVLDSAGTPLAGARVTLTGYNRDHEDLVPSGERGSIAEHVVSQFRSRHASSTATGAFSFADVSGGSYQFSVQPKGRSFREEFGPIELKDGEVLEGLEFAVKFGLSIEGQLEMSDGTDLPTAEYSLLQLYREGTRVKSALVQADGSFRFEQLDAESYSISALQLPKGLSLLIRTNVRAGTEGLRLFLQPSAEISGRVVDADGKPIAGARVSYEYGKDSYQFEGVRIVVPTITRVAGDDGRFVFEVPPGARGRLTARGPLKVTGSGQILIKRAHRDDVSAGSEGLLLILR